MQYKNYFDHFVKITRHSGLSEIKISNRILISLYLKDSGSGGQNSTFSGGRIFDHEVEIVFVHEVKFVQ
jgi:hypothetical protein